MDDERRPPPDIEIPRSYARIIEIFVAVLFAVALLFIVFDPGFIPDLPKENWPP